MHKFQNFTNQASMVGRSMVGMTNRNGQHDGQMQHPHPHVKTRSNGHPSASQPPQPDTVVSLSFNVPFNTSLAGPEKDEVLYASPGAFARWTFEIEKDDGGNPIPTYELPVHSTNVENLRSYCRHLQESTPVKTTVVYANPTMVGFQQRRPVNIPIANVCLTGEYKLVQEIRGSILTTSPISLRCLTVDIHDNLIEDEATKKVRVSVLNHLDEISKRCKADIFLLHPKPKPRGNATGATGATEKGNELRYDCLIYGDAESAEHAKMRVLVMIDQILHRHVDVLQLELSLHTIIAGRAKRNIKNIESATKTAIFFPPPFPHVYGYTPRGAGRRQVDDIIITGDHLSNIRDAKSRLHDMVLGTKLFIKEVEVTQHKVDSIILERLDKMRKIIEINGSSILLPPLGVPQGIVRVQGVDILHVERTVREVMGIASQFYQACWVVIPDASVAVPNPVSTSSMLSDICINSGAEVIFDNWIFHIYGSDEAVKIALSVISTINIVKSFSSTLAVKIELATEHKEFVSGKKNGKINKIMSHSNVQIVFDGWNEYNFFIDVRGSQFADISSGLDLVEQEMPASISFHVPDQYHKRIIGVGGSHIQKIMKKYSVFVKFSNAQERGTLNQEEDDYFKMDNVICRTPARNAQNLDLVKQEIMDLVEKVDAEPVTERIHVDRLYQRELLHELPRIQALEHKWNCKIEFPSTEAGSNFIKVSGPQYQVPPAIDEFLGMVPETHSFTFDAPAELNDYLCSAEFETEVLDRIRNQLHFDVVLKNPSDDATPAQSTPLEPPADSSPAAAKAEDGEVTSDEVASVSSTRTILFKYTRNYEGGLQDAMDSMVSKLIIHGLDTKTIRGNIVRPESDSFEGSLPYFEAKVLHPAEPPVGATDSPTRSAFNHELASAMDGSMDVQPGSFFSKFKTSLIGNKKTGSNSPGSLFKHTSSNASRASLVSLMSLESQGSGFRHPWNDSGINLPEEDHHNGHVAAATPGMAFNSSAASPSMLNWAGGMSPAAAARIDNKPFPGLAAVTSGDTTPTSRHDPKASITSLDSGRPSTSHSFHNGIGTSLSATPPASSTLNGNGSGNAGPGPIAPPPR